MKTTILIDKATADRIKEIGVMLGHTSMSGTAEFLLRISCRIVEREGVDAFISREKSCTEDMSSSGAKG